jgi:hypothetical protein
VETLGRVRANITRLYTPQLQGTLHQVSAPAAVSRSRPPLSPPPGLGREGDAAENGPETGDRNGATAPGPGRTHERRAAGRRAKRPAQPAQPAGAQSGGGGAEPTRTQRAKRPTPPSQPASPSSLPGFRARAPCDPPRRINKSKRAARFASARLPVCFSFPPVVRSVREPPRPSTRARSLATSTRRIEIREPSRLSLLLSRCGICIRDSFPDGGAFQRINASKSEDSPTDGSGGNGSSRALRP